MKGHCTCRLYKSVTPIMKMGFIPTGSRGIANSITISIKSINSRKKFIMDSRTTNTMLLLSDLKVFDDEVRIITNTKVELTDFLPHSVE